MSATLTSLRVLVCRSVGAGVYVREINKARQGCPEGKELLKGEGRLRMRAAEPDEREGKVEIHLGNAGVRMGGAS